MDEQKIREFTDASLELAKLAVARPEQAEALGKASLDVVLTRFVILATNGFKCCAKPCDYYPKTCVGHVEIRESHYSDGSCRRWECGSEVSSCTGEATAGETHCQNLLDNTGCPPPADTEGDGRRPYIHHTHKCDPSE